MNIFVTDECPIKCAQALDDLRLNKMILESVQMCAVALAENGCPPLELPQRKDGTPFKASGWSKHPCTVWVKQSRANYEWLVEHTKALILEMARRRGTLHSMHRNMPRLIQGSKYMPLAGLTPFANSSMFPDDLDVIMAYKATMLMKWAHDKRKPKWTNSDVPDWAPCFKRQGHQPSGASSDPLP